MEKILNFCKIGGKRVEKYEGKRKYVATGDIVDNKILNYTEVSFDEKPSRANQDVKIGDVLFAKMKDTIKVVNIDSNNVDKIFSTGFFVLTPKDNVKSEYLYWLFNSPKFNTEKNKNCKGATQKAINEQGLNKITINRLPSIAEQNSIISKFNNIKNIIELRKKQIEELNQIIKSQFVEMFGDIRTNNKNWKIKKLDEIARVGSSHRVFTTEFVEEGIPFYRGTEIGQLANGIKPTNTYYIAKEHYLRICDNETKPKIGDLLMPSICDKGQIWLVDTEEDFYYKDGRVLFISLIDKNLNPKYLHEFMKTKTQIEYSKIGSGSTFAEFKIFLLKKFDILIPPIELQNQFAEFVQVTDKQKFEIEKSLKETQELYESLMERYFG